MPKRIEKRFEQLKKQKRKGLITFVMGGDPDHETSRRILNSLPASGADFIELGMAFSDPMADGPAIQAAGQRALKAGACLKKTLQLVKDFRKGDDETPLILMGYFNPIYIFGVPEFVEAAVAAGVDGLIIVDLPPEEDEELLRHARDHGLALIRLIAPTTSEGRLEKILHGASGFLYYVSITGITGTARADVASIRPQLERIRRHTTLPIAVGFGINSPQDAAAIAPMADAVVVGSALVRTIEKMKPGNDIGDELSFQIKCLRSAF